MPTTDQSPGLKATFKALEAMGVTDPQPVGAIPLFINGEWTHVRNAHGIPMHAEYGADPVKVEALRRRAHALINGSAMIDGYDSLTQRAGYKNAKTILTTPIKKATDVKRWAESVFNWGPGRSDPHDAVELAPDGFNADVQGMVVAPAEAGNKGVVVIHPGIQGYKVGHVFGPRHEVSKAAFGGSSEAAVEPVAAVRSPKTSKAPTTTRKAAKAPVDPNAPVRRRGRPRKDGLVPGSDEAKAADQKKKDDAAAAKRKATADRKAAATKTPGKTGAVKTTPKAKVAPAAKAKTKVVRGPRSKPATEAPEPFVAPVTNTDAPTNMGASPVAEPAPRDVEPKAARKIKRRA